MFSGCRFLECPPTHSEWRAVHPKAIRPFSLGASGRQTFSRFIEGIWLVEAALLIILQVTVT